MFVKGRKILGKKYLKAFRVKEIDGVLELKDPGSTKARRNELDVTQ